MKDWKLAGQLFVSFMKIGPVTFGGGYAMIPLIEKEVVERRKWIKSEDIADVFAIAESIPGAIAINSATFIGYRIAGIRGAMAAMAGILFPTFLIVIGLCLAFMAFKDNAKVKAAFEGIRPAIVALIVYAGYKIGKTAVLDKTTFCTVIGTVAALLLLHKHVSPVIIIVSGAVLGIVQIQIKRKLGMAIRLDGHGGERTRYKTPDYYMGDGI